MFKKIKLKREITALERNAIIIEYLTQELEVYGKHPETHELARGIDVMLHFQRMKRRYLTK